MVNVLYDFQIFASQRYGGISRYCLELCRRIDRLAGFSSRIEAPWHINAYLGDDLQYGTGIYWPLRTEGALANLQKAAVFVGDALASFMRCSRADIVHETFYYGRFSGHSGKSARVVTVHDMIHERFPGSFSYGDRTVQRKREAVARADHVICNSHRTRIDLLEGGGVTPEKVSTVYLGFSFPHDAGVSGSPVPFPYVLFVGNRGGYKNFAALVTAIGLSPYLRKEYGLVCFGGGELSADEWHLLKAHELDTSRVIHVQGDDENLARYYRHAQAFIYPSLYEGFGIPPLEAMVNCCPVVCGHVASLPEVVGDAAEYCSPDSPESIRTALERILDDVELRTSRIEAGRERVGRFSWEKCACETAEIYRRLS